MTPDYGAIRIQLLAETLRELERQAKARGMNPQMYAALLLAAAVDAKRRAAPEEPT